MNMPIRYNINVSEEDANELDKLTASYQYYDRMQYVMKIRLNSIYGVMGNAFFRYFDLRNAESTTRSGRAVLMHMVKKVAEQLDGEYKYPSKSIIYGDTDSAFFDIGKTSSLDESISKVTTIANTVNNSFKPFMQQSFLCSDKFDNRIMAEWEFISDRAIFVDKKLYVLHLTYKDGKPCDKMKIMGLQLKKTTIPKPISKQLTKFVESLLKGNDWYEIGKEIVAYKDKLLAVDNVLEIGLPKGIKGIEDYTERYDNDNTTNLPGHVAAAMFWNKCVDEYGDKSSPKISSGFKIKTFYFTKTFGRFKSIAVPTDTKKLPDWFMTHYHNIIDRSAQVERLVDNPLLNIIEAIGKKIPTKKSLLVDDLVEY